VDLSIAVMLPCLAGRDGWTRVVGRRGSGDRAAAEPLQGAQADAVVTAATLSGATASDDRGGCETSDSLSDRSSGSSSDGQTHSCKRRCRSAQRGTRKAAGKGVQLDAGAAFGPATHMDALLQYIENPAAAAEAFPGPLQKDAAATSVGR
jgi:hypothetical protein